MQLVEVIPLAKSILKDRLTYFSAKPISIGAIVSASARGKEIRALVTAVRLVDASAKSEVRTAGFALKKIKAVLAPQLVLPQFIEAAARAADWYVGHLGQVLAALIPERVVRQAGELGDVPTRQPKGPRTERLLIQDSDEERIAHYRSLIREEFAKNASVFITLPTINDCLRLTEILSRGIPQYVISLHGDLATRELLARWRDAITRQHPQVIIATPQFLSLPRADVTTIIIEKENGNGYKQLARPFIDFRHFAELYAEALGAKLMIGDLAVRTETMARLERRELAAARPPKSRLLVPAASQIVPIRSGEVLSQAVAEAIELTLAAKEKIFILANRRGLAPIVVCSDCGELVICVACGAPIVLHRQLEDKREQNIFLCHQCGQSRRAAEKCRSCQSWRLRELGIGIEKVALELKKRFPGTAIFELDSDNVKTSKRAAALATKWNQAPTGILLGTEMALGYLTQPVATAIVVAVDSLLAVPDFRIGEKLFTLLVRLRQITRRHFLIQTRYEAECLFTDVIQGSLLEFYRREINERRSFNYPPFKLLVKVTAQGPKTQIVPEMKELETRLKRYEPVIFPAAGGTPQRYRLHLLLRLEPASWPNQEITRVLRELPPRLVVNVDPESIL